jgi:hypothetical protein
MVNTDDDSDCRVHVNSRPAALLTRSDGVDIVGTLKIPAFIHERKHIIMMNTNDDNDCRVHVNLRPATLLTRSDGMDVAGVRGSPWPFGSGPTSIPSGPTTTTRRR